MFSQPLLVLSQCNHYLCIAMSYHHLWKSLVPLYGEHEAQAVARLVYEQQFGLSFTDICCGKDTQLNADEQTLSEEIARRLLTNEPVQYVLGKALFAGRVYHVAPGVLIPRPETEQLCEWVVEACSRNGKMFNMQPTILDIGTGSGCIAITLALALTDHHVTAWDISETALSIAQRNAKRHDADICFLQQDILHRKSTGDRWNIIVSNPPYVCEQERDEMDKNVLAFEPQEALFVPDDDPLLFYRAITDYARQTLLPGGMLFLEGNTRFAEQTASLLKEAGMTGIEIRNDMYHRPRFICGRQP